MEKGIILLGDLYCTNTLKSFDDLKQRYGLQKTQFWRYLQLHYVLQKIFGSSLESPK